MTAKVFNTDNALGPLSFDPGRTAGFSELVEGVFFGEDVFVEAATLAGALLVVAAFSLADGAVPAKEAVSTTNVPVRIKTERI